MKKFKLYYQALFIFILMIGISSFKAEPVRSVNGGGAATELGEKSTFVFNAVETSDGVHGFLEYKIRGIDINFRMKITCLSINQNRATLGGEVVNVSGTNIPSYIFVGQKASFTVEDNGSGAGDDKISDVILGSNVSCANNWNTYIFVDGNVNIHD